MCFKTIHNGMLPVVKSLDSASKQIIMEVQTSQPNKTVQQYSKKQGKNYLFATNLTMQVTVRNSISEIDSQFQHILKSCMTKLPLPRQELQSLLDQALQIGGEISYIDQEIEQYEDLLVGEGWSEGNIKVGWTRGDAFAARMSTRLSNKDRLFSLSSVTSPASLHLAPIENEKTTPHEAPRFYRRKKKKKHKGVSKRPPNLRGPRTGQKRGRPRKIKCR